MMLVRRFLDWFTGIEVVSAPTQTEHKTDTELRDWQIANWQRLSRGAREDLVFHLEQNLNRDADGRAILDRWVEQKRAGEIMECYHFGLGMWVRNVLREVLEDHLLPAVSYRGGAKVRNWDDFYYGAIDQLAVETLAERDNRT